MNDSFEEWLLDVSEKEIDKRLIELGLYPKEVVEKARGMIDKVLVQGAKEALSELEPVLNKGK